MTPRRLVLALASVALLAPVPAASAADEKPVPRCGLVIVDAGDDATSQVPAAARPLPGALEITRTFFDHEPAVAPATPVTAVNVQVRDLSTTLPLGATSVNWTVQWTSPTGPTRFVRAVVDYTGSTIYEFGELVPPVGGLVLPRYEPRGTTTGKLVTGPEGVISIVIPATWDGAAGSKLTDIYAQASEGRQVVPNMVNTPTRGLSSPADRAPDAGDVAKWTVAGCPPPPVVVP